MSSVRAILEQAIADLLGATTKAHLKSNRQFKQIMLQLFLHTPARPGNSILMYACIQNETSTAYMPHNLHHLHFCPAVRTQAAVGAAVDNFVAGGHNLLGTIVEAVEDIPTCMGKKYISSN